MDNENKLAYQKSVSSTVLLWVADRTKKIKPGY